MDSNRFDRQARFFGKEGQRRISQAKVVVVGVGGLGTHVTQQLTYLGVKWFGLIDSEVLEISNLNRYVGARPDDVRNRLKKVDLGERIVREIYGSEDGLTINKVHDSFIGKAGYALVKQADYVMGCVDQEGARLILNELTAAYQKTYIDLASDIEMEDAVRFGGRVFVSSDGKGCVHCMKVISLEDAQRDLQDPESRKAMEELYGVKKDALDGRGPSVVSINGVVASLAVTEFLVGLTGIRPQQKLTTYYGHLGRITVNQDVPPEECYVCKGIWAKGEKAETERYITENLGLRLR